MRVKRIRVTADTEKLKKRKGMVEHPFGTIKRTMNAGYFLTKGIESITGEIALAFLAYNLKRVISILGTERLVEVMRTGIQSASLCFV